MTARLPRFWSVLRSFYANSWMAGLEEARDLFHQCEDEAGWAYAELDRRLMYRIANGVTDSASSAEKDRAIAFAMSTGDRYLLPRLLDERAIDLLEEGDFSGALACWKSIARSADPDDVLLHGMLLANQALTQFYLRRYADAVDTGRRAVALMEQARPWNLPIYLTNLALAQLLLGDRV